MTDTPSWLSPRQSQHDPLTWYDRFRAAMIGGAVGDALGAGVRRQTTRGLRHWFGAAGVTDLLPAFGRRGAGTELTQLTVFTLEALLRAKAAQSDPANPWLPTEFVRTNHLRWLYTQGVPWEYAMSSELRSQPEPNGWLLERPELFSTRNPAGRALRGLGAAAVHHGGAAEPPLGDEGVAECVVWAAPAMVWGGAEGMVFTAAADVSYRLTSDTATHAASGLHADVLAQLIRGVALWDAVGASESYLARLYQEQVTPVALHRAIRAAMFAVQQGRRPDPDTVDIEFDTGGRLGELGIALAAVASTDTVADAILMAVNQSADSSVTGALAGQLAGAVHGPGGIPDRWRAELELGEIIETLCSDAAEAFAPPPPPPPLPRWAQRYVTDTRSAFSGPLELEAREEPSADGRVTSVDTQPLAVSSERVGAESFPAHGGERSSVTEPDGATPTQVLPVIDDDTPAEPGPSGGEVTGFGLVVEHEDPIEDAEPGDHGPADHGPADHGPADDGAADDGAAHSGFVDSGFVDVGPADPDPDSAAPDSFGPESVDPDPDHGVTAEPAATDPVLAGPVPHHEDAGPVRQAGQRFVDEPDWWQPAAQDSEFVYGGFPDHGLSDHTDNGHDVGEPEQPAPAEEETPVRARIDLTVPEPEPEVASEPEPEQRRSRRGPARLWPDDDGSGAHDEGSSGAPDDGFAEQGLTEQGLTEQESASEVTMQWEQPWLDPAASTRSPGEIARAGDLPEDAEAAQVREPAPGPEPASDASNSSEAAEVGTETAVVADVPRGSTVPELDAEAQDTSEPSTAAGDGDESWLREAPRSHHVGSAEGADTPRSGSDVAATTAEPTGEGLHAAAAPAPVGNAQRSGGGHAAPEDVDAVAPSLTERVLGCFLGGALGDALGSDLEFVPAEQITERFGPEGPRGLREAYGVQGAITDETQLTLFTAEGLVRGGIARRTHGREDPIPEVQLAYQRWLHTQGVAWDAAVGPLRAEYPQPDGWLICVPGLFSTRAPGRTVLRSLDGFGRGARPGSIGEPVNDSKGCGGVMRAAPVALWSSDPAEVFELAARTAALTHGHLSGYLSAGAFAVIVQQAVLGRGLDDGVWLALQVLETWEGHEETSNALAVAVDLAAHGVPGPDRIAETLGGGWVGEQALAIAVCATLAAGDDVELALSTAVHHSGDSDATGAICGNIIGALVGIAGLPVAWLADLELRDVVEQVAMDCVVEFDRGPGGEAAVTATGQVDAHQAHEEDWRERYPVRADRAPVAPVPGEATAAAGASGAEVEPATRMLPVVDAEQDRAETFGVAAQDDARGGDAAVAEPTEPTEPAGPAEPVEDPPTGHSPVEEAPPAPSSSSPSSSVQRQSIESRPVESTGSADPSGHVPESGVPGEAVMPPEMIDPESRQPKPAPRRINPTRSSAVEDTGAQSAAPGTDDERTTGVETPDPASSRRAD